MNNKKFLWAGMTLLLLATLFVAIQSATATGTPDQFCGQNNAGGDTTIRVKKNVFCAKDTTWDWTILKQADATDLTLSLGQSHLVNYLVTASAVATTDYSVAGEILIINLTDNPVVINSVVDSLGPISACRVTGVDVTLPYTLNGHFEMRCRYSGSQQTQPNSNTATVNYGAGVDASATAGISWIGVDPTSTDECATISDTYPGGPNQQVCANGQQTFTFNYSRWIGPYDVCGEHTVPNTASFLTNDTGDTGTSSWVVNVNVPCAGGCTLTPGYWKTHSSYGPAPYDDTWAQIGENTTFFLSGKSYYQALWTSPQGNAYWILAHAYIAAKLNFLNDADSTPAVDAAFAAATGLFQAWTPAQIGALQGNSPLRAQFISLATTLDNYNNGLIGPGHCDE